MKLSFIKFINAIMFEGAQVTFITNEKVELEAKGGLVFLTNKEQVAVPLSNVVCMKVNQDK
jgi:hypothetical protein